MADNISNNISTITASRPQALTLPSQISGTSSSSSSSSTNPNPLLSSGNETVIQSEHFNVGRDVESILSQPAQAGANNEEQINIDAASSTIPPILLDMINKTYTGINFYKKIIEDSEQLDLNWISEMFLEDKTEFTEKKKQSENENPDDEDNDNDPRISISKLVAKHVQVLEEKQQKATDKLDKHLAQKLDLLNELLAYKIKAAESDLREMKINESKYE